MIHVLGILLFSSSLGISLAVKKLQSKNKLLALKDQVEDMPEDMSVSEEILPSPKQEMIIAREESKKEERELNVRLMISGLGLGLASAGHLFYFPLGLMSLPILGYSSLEIFKNAYQGIRERKLNISQLDTIAIYTGVSFGWYVLTALSSVAYDISEKVMYRTHRKTQKKFFDIFNGNSLQVWLVTDGIEISVPLEKIHKEDRIVINTGEMIPCDGIIEEGISHIDQHILTGEAQPEEKTVGHEVLATSVVVSGRITVRVKQTGADTVAAHITQVLMKTDDFISKLKIQSEDLANRSVLPTFGVAGIALVISGPMAVVVALSSNFSEVMRFSVPLTMLNYLHKAFNKGLLIKDGRSLDQLSKVDTVVFDKTGTLTLDQVHLSKIYPVAGFGEKEILYYTAAAEYRQTHPIAKAILNAASQQGIILPYIDNAQYRIGYGISVNLNGEQICVGSARFMGNENISLPADLNVLENNAHQQGFSLIYTAVNGILCGVIELHPTVRQEAKAVIQHLQKRGLQIYILSGDHAGPVKNLALQLGVNNYIAETLPEDKAKVIEELQQNGKTVCFVGDGINDAIALKTAAVSISPQNASHVAVDNAQIVLMDQNLYQILDAFELADRFNINQQIVINAGTIIPSLMSMGGAVLLGTTFAQVTILYLLSIVIATGGSMYPLLSKDNQKSSNQIS